jgi:transposase-like protein
MFNKRCPNCKSKDTRKHGLQMTKQWGIKQRYFCRKCGSTFY